MILNQKQQRGKMITNQSKPSLLLHSVQMKPSSALIRGETMIREEEWEEEKAQNSKLRPLQLVYNPLNEGLQYISLACHG